MLYVVLPTLGGDLRNRDLATKSEARQLLRLEPTIYLLLDRE